MCVENVKRMGALHPSPLRERELVRSNDETNMESERKYSERTGSGVHNNTRNVVCFFDLNYYFAAM